MQKLTYIITGTSRGIGNELTKQALDAGHTVYALAREPKRSESLAALKRKFEDRLHLIEADVKDTENLEKIRKSLSEQTIDVLINNAGMFDDADRAFPELDLNVIDRTFATNVVGAMAVTQTFLGRLLESQRPLVANITSLMGSIADNRSGGYYGYRISKAALNMFGRTFAVDFPQIITLLIHPGWVQTEMGGPQAPVTPSDSAAGILNLIGKATKQDSGRFFNYRGEELPW